MKAKELIAVLKKQGAEIRQGKGSHVVVKLNGKASVIPVHSKELKRGTFKAILKQLGLREEDLK